MSNFRITAITNYGFPPCMRMDSPIPDRGDLSRDCKRAFSSPTCSSICSNLISARLGNCLVKLQPSLDFACFLCSDSFYNDSEDLLDILRGVFSCGFSLLDYVPWIYITLVKSTVVGRLLPGGDFESLSVMPGRSPRSEELNTGHVKFLPCQPGWIRRPPVTLRYRIYC